MPARNLPALRQLFTLLEEHFDATTGYEEGWNDAAIATACGLRERYVSHVRSVAFGGIPVERRERRKPMPAPMVHVTANSLPTLKLGELERAAIEIAVSAAGSLQRAAPILGISRHALSRRVRAHGLTLERLLRSSFRRDTGADAVRVILKNGEPWKSDDVADALGWGAVKTRNVLSYLKKRGEIVHDGTAYMVRR